MSTLERIKKLCAEHEISIYKLEKNIGIAPSTINKWEVSSPTCKAISLVANYFDVSVDFLLGRTNNQHSHKKEKLISESCLKINRQLEKYDLSDSQVDTLCHIIDSIINEF